MESLLVLALSIRNFRNLAQADFRPSPRFNVFSGDNGQGKTNVLEALYAVLSSKSFRTSKVADLMPHTEPGGVAEVVSVRAKVREGDMTREQRFAVDQGTRSVRIDDKRPRSLLAYATASPVVVFHPGELSLSTGPSAERRKLLDRVALFVAPTGISELEAYTRAQRSRQKTLEARGIDATDVDHWETLVIQHGLALMEARAAAAERIVSRALAAFASIFTTPLDCAISYVPGAPREAEAFRAELRKNRALDLRRGTARIGPHRDDLALSLKGAAARTSASQGQHRALVLALKAAEIAVIGEARGARPVLLLDDVSSELDRARTEALFSFLRATEGQVFLTTTRPELIATEGAERADFQLRQGVISPLS